MPVVNVVSVKCYCHHLKSLLREQHSFNISANIHKKFNSCTKPPHFVIKTSTMRRETASGGCKLVHLPLNPNEGLPIQMAFSQC